MRDILELLLVLLCMSCFFFFGYNAGKEKAERQFAEALCFHRQIVCETYCNLP